MFPPDVNEPAVTLKGGCYAGLEKLRGAFVKGGVRGGRMEAAPRRMAVAVEFEAGEAGEVGEGGPRAGEPVVGGEGNPNSGERVGTVLAVADGEAGGWIALVVGSRRLLAEAEGAEVECGGARGVVRLFEGVVESYVIGDEEEKEDGGGEGEEEEGENSAKEKEKKRKMLKMEAMEKKLKEAMERRKKTSG